MFRSLHNPQTQTVSVCISVAWLNLTAKKTDTDYVEFKFCQGAARRRFLRPSPQVGDLMMSQRMLF